jgi:hypothetical protein
MVSHNYFVEKELWKQKIFKKTAKILFFMGIQPRFWGENASFYGPIVFQREIAVIWRVLLRQ